MSFSERACFRSYLWLYWDKSLVLNFNSGTKTQTRLHLLVQNVFSRILLSINKQNKRHTKPPQTHIAFIMPRPKGIGSRHKIGTGGNHGRQETAHCNNRCFNLNDSHSNINELSFTVIHIPPPLNDSVINTPQVSSVCQQSSSSSQNTTPEPQDSSIPGGTSPDPSNTVPPPSTKNGSCNIYGCIMDVSKLTPAQRQQNSVMLLQYYHNLCNKS